MGTLMLACIIVGLMLFSALVGEAIATWRFKTAMFALLEEIEKVRKVVEGE